MRQSADDNDDTIPLTRRRPELPPAFPQPRLAIPRSGRVPAWTLAIPAALLVAVVAGGWLIWPPAAPEQQAAPLRTAISPVPIAPPVLPPPQAPGVAAVKPAPRGKTAEAQAPIPAASTPTVKPHVEAETPEPLLGQHEFPIHIADEQQVLDHRPTEAEPALTIFRFAQNPRILVLDFTSLRDQGRMLNRAAAFAEKSGLPHDRLLTDSELDTAIRAGGDTPETFYYGHDYGASSLARFFALADRDGVGLLSDEVELRRLLRQNGWFERDARAGLISIPQAGADKNVTMEARGTILHHELSHGEYFTNPHYAAFVHHFWTQSLTSAERERIRHHLRSLGYDASLDDVMENEAQAYLMFTGSPTFFSPDMVGMSTTRLWELRTGFFRSMPSGWLHDSLGRFLTANGVAASERR
jgi:hypothetical protein